MIVNRVSEQWELCTVGGADLGGADRHAHIAQSVEHFLGKEEVIGSIPIVSTIYWQLMATPGRASNAKKLGN